MVVGQRPVSISADYAREIAYETIKRLLFNSSRGATIGRYRVDKIIGTGGMGEVYRAHDPELNRPVAIKRVRAGVGALDNERLRDALMRDARSAAQVQHPHVVEIYDVGVDGEDLYVVMELVEGPNLEQWLEQDHRSWKSVLELFISVGRGLACAHAHGIVHRDFKPANVLIGPDGRPRVADFGLSQLIDDLRLSRSQPLSVTLDDQAEIAGTPQYMAPEQYWSAEIGPAADQFAFCNALYRALFRTSPFEGETFHRLAVNVSEGRVRPPPPRSGVPRTLTQAVLRGLNAEPTRRHRSMDTLIDRLCSVLTRRYWILGGIGGTALLLGSALLGHHAWPATPTSSPCDFAAVPWIRDQRDDLERSLSRRSEFGEPATAAIMDAFDRHSERWTEARADACAATRVRGEQSDELMDLRFECFERQRAYLSSIFERIAALDGPTPGDALELIEDLPPASDCGAEPVRRSSSRSSAYAEDFDHSYAPKVRAELRDLAARLGWARAEYAASRYASAQREAAEIVERAEALGAWELLADALLMKGVLGLKLARTEDDRRTSHRTLDRALLTAIRSESTRLVSRVHIAQADTTNGWLSADERSRRLDIASAHARTLPDAEALLARVELVRGRNAMSQGHAEQAAGHLERVGRLVPGGTLSRLARSDLAAVYLMQGELHAAKRIWSSLRAEFEEQSSSDSRLGWILHNLALVALRETDYDRALSLAQQAEQIYETNPAIEPRELQRVRVRIGRALRLLGRQEQSRRVLRSVIEDLELIGVAGHEVLLEALDEMVEVELGRDDYAAAVEVARHWLEIAQTRYRAEDPNVARARMMLAKAAHGGGALARARAQIELAYGHRHGMSPLLQAEVSFYYAQIVHEQGNREPAARLYHETIQVLEREPKTDHLLAMVHRWGRPRGYEGERNDE